mmetsp:Transcript_22851/g.40483  ORF Transcript_22851/g.40483 Transcript_22851/m.40483 type:complete len:110 (-) Transcript_22851:122-451(-)
MRQQQLEFPLNHFYSLPLCTVHHQQHCLRIREVHLPRFSQRLLSAQIPALKSHFASANLLNVRSYCGLRTHHLAQVQLVQRRGLACIVQTHDDGLDLLLALEEVLPQRP